jgi:hypothetical protein
MARLTAQEREVVVRRLKSYPANFGASWGAVMVVGNLFTGYRGCHLCCFVADYTGPVSDHFKGLVTLQSPDDGDPAVALAEFRGELTTRGIFRAYEDLKAEFGDREGNRFADELGRDPVAVARVFESRTAAAA